MPNESTPARPRPLRLEELVQRGDYPTLSEAFRDSIDRVTLGLPKGRVVDLQPLGGGGDSVSLKDAIRNAIREYVRGQIGEARQ